MTNYAHKLHNHRRGGILLHPTSLPGNSSQGQISHDAYRFIEFLAQCGMSVWQMLPFGPTHADGSPYMVLSAHACDSYLISLDWLADRQLLTAPVLAHDRSSHRRLLQIAYGNFLTHQPVGLTTALQRFIQQHAYWLDDYALFMALREAFDNRPWLQWEGPVRDRHGEALVQARHQYAQQIGFHQFVQFVFFTQWQELKEYAKRHQVLLFGDMPIYVALDSADVWAQRELFNLDERGEPLTVAGVPPDYFSATGQRWGNPQYRWAEMKKTDFQWWHDRIRTQLQLFDLIRIDHFRGLSAYWEIPAAETSAIHGHWVKAPGKALLKSLYTAFAELPLVAEDLGHITAEVHELRRNFSLPGMKILQFAFDGDPTNIYLPHHHEFNSVVYTGTHDNDTTLAWHEKLPPATQDYIRQYFQHSSPSLDTQMPDMLIRTALASVCCLAVVPLQDILGLGEGHRMNTPGTTQGNWRWRFEWSQFPATLTSRLRELLQRYDRLPAGD
ncbi:MAG: 4-alpha-glucanotransferase [Gammaproteobacteria bacterium]|nr:4-alpha-glucanotransferase [Gammaproteobacteria bacterium]